MLVPKKEEGGTVTVPVRSSHHHLSRGLGTADVPPPPPPAQGVGHNPPLNCTYDVPAENEVGDLLLVHSKPTPRAGTLLSTILETKDNNMLDRPHQALMPPPLAHTELLLLRCFGL